MLAAAFVGACAGESQQPSATGGSGGMALNAGAPATAGRGGGAGKPASAGRAGSGTASGGAASSGAGGASMSESGAAGEGGHAGVPEPGSGGASGGGGALDCSNSTTRTGDVVANSQAALAQLRNVSRVKGNLKITGSVTDLEPLGCLTHVEGSLSIVELPELRTLDGLERLARVDVSVITGMGCNWDQDNCIGTPKLESFAGLRNLELVGQTLDFGHCWMVDSISKVYCDGPALVERLEGFDRLTSVGVISLSGLPELVEVSGFGAVTSLAGLDLLDLPRLATVEAFEQLESLRSLTLNDGMSLPFLSRISNVERMTLAGQPSVTGLAGVQTVGTLELENSGLLDLDGFQSLTSIERLKISECSRLESLNGLENVTHLGSLELDDCESLRDISALGGSSSIGYLALSGSPIDDLSPLSGAGPHLDRLFLSSLALASLDGLEGVTEIDEVYVSDDGTIRDISGLANLTRVGDFSLHFLELTSFPSFASLERARSLDLIGCNFVDLTPFSNVAGHIDWLNLANMPALTSLDGLENVTSLGQLAVSQAPVLTDISGLAQVVSAEYLGFYAAGILDFNALGSLAGTVESIGASGMPALTTLDGLEGLTAAARVSLSQNPVLSNVHGLSGLTALESLSIVENASLPTCEAEWLRDHIGVENLASVEIDGNDDAGVCIP